MKHTFTFWDMNDPMPEIKRDQFTISKELLVTSTECINVPPEWKYSPSRVECPWCGRLPGEWCLGTKPGVYHGWRKSAIRQYVKEQSREQS